jgi:hypothetical protein
MWPVMRNLVRLVCAVALVSAAACGPSTSVKPPDAGVDTSCGLDCVAQKHFGLVVNRCFEYSSSASRSDPASLGLLVKPVVSLEGGVQVLPVEYLQGGQRKMIDNFGLVGGDLRLMRREFSMTSQSVTYKTASGISGVAWLTQATGLGETLSTPASAFVVGQSGTGTTTDTTYKVTTLAPSASELKTPLQTYPNGLKLIVSETPDHGSDARRVFVPEVGFTTVSTSFSLSGGTTQEFALQRIREIGAADGGNVACSLGAP